MIFQKYFDAVEVGETFTSRGRTITETDIVMFAALTGDWYPLHTDETFAAQTPFGRRIAHGLLTLSVGMGLIPLEPGPVIAFYGIEKLRFTAPVFIGDTVHTELKVLDKQERNEDEGVLTVRMRVVKQDGRAALIGTLKVLMARKPSA